MLGIQLLTSRKTEAQPVMVVSLDDVQRGDKVVVLVEGEWLCGYVLKTYERRDFWTHESKPVVLATWWNGEMWKEGGFNPTSVARYEWQAE